MSMLITAISYLQNIVNSSIQIDNHDAISDSKVCIDSDLNDFVCVEDWGEMVIHKNNTTTLYSFDMMDAYQHISQYYKNSYHIQNQFLLDMSRSTIYFNKKKINNIIKLDDYLVYTLKDIYLPMITLCTQSLFAIILQKLYPNLEKHTYIGELSKDDIYSKSQHIHFKSVGVYLQCHIYKTLRIFSVIDGIDYTQHIIKIHIVIDECNKNVTVQIKLCK